MGCTGTWKLAFVFSPLLPCQLKAAWFVSVAKIVGDRLLAQHVLAGLECGPRQFESGGARRARHQSGRYPFLACDQFRCGCRIRAESPACFQALLLVPVPDPRFRHQFSQRASRLYPGRCAPAAHAPAPNTPTRMVIPSSSVFSTVIETVGHRPSIEVSMKVVDEEIHKPVVLLHHSTCRMRHDDHVRAAPTIGCWLGVALWQTRRARRHANAPSRASRSSPPRRRSSHDRR